MLTKQNMSYIVEACSHIVEIIGAVEIEAVFWSYAKKGVLKHCLIHLKTSVPESKKVSGLQPSYLKTNSGTGFFL